MPVRRSERASGAGSRSRHCGQPCWGHGAQDTFGKYWHACLLYGEEVLPKLRELAQRFI